MKKALAVLLVAGALVAPATGVSAAGSPMAGPKAATDGTIGIRLLEAPSNRRDDPRAKTYIVDHVKPGTTIQRKAEISNKSNKAVDLQLYAAAAEIKDGSFFPGDGRAVNELSSWTKVSVGSAHLAPGATQTIEGTIAVPPKASTGERYAVIWAEAASPPGTGVREVNRVGIRIYLSVGPGGEPPSDFTVDTLEANRLPSGQPVVYALVHNTGGRALDMSGSLSLSNGPGGLNAGPFTAKLGTTLGVRDTEPVTVLLDKALPAGPWLARITLESGLTKRSAQATITFPDAAGPGNEASAAPVVLQQNDDSSGLPLVPILGAAAGVGLLGLIALTVFKRPSRRRTGGTHGKHGR
jgi:hypothetical protein